MALNFTYELRDLEKVTYFSQSPSSTGGEFVGELNTVKWGQRLADQCVKG